jgi:hypothetical protein
MALRLTVAVQCQPNAGNNGGSAMNGAGVGCLRSEQAEG